MRIDLDQTEWNTILSILSRASWSEVNQLIIRIADQMRQHAAGMNQAAGGLQPFRPDGEDKRPQ